MCTRFIFIFLLDAMLKPPCMAQSVNRWYNVACVRDNTCRQVNAVCFVGRCLCRPGFFLSTHDYTCSSICSPFGLQKTFTEYPGSKTERKHILVQDGLTLDACKTLCLTSAGCLTFDFKGSGGRCVIHDATSRAVRSKWYPQTSQGWSHYQRNCQMTPAKDPESCVDWHTTGATTCTYFIRMTDNNEIRKVWCDMQSGDGGWLVFQRRRDGSVDFFRSWQDYENGFGDIWGEFWLGLSHLHRLTKGRPHQLRVDFVDDNGEHHYAEYSTFRVAGPETNYTLTVSGYSGTAGNAMQENNNKSFKIFPTRSYVWLGTRCTQWFHGAWWFGSCTEGNLNGDYGSYLWWEVPSNYIKVVKFSEMKLKPYAFSP